MFLQLSAQELVLGNRLEFTGLGRSIITKVIAAEPFGGQCPCCLRERVLTEAGRVVSSAEFDHFFHRSLNKSDHGWLICAACHDELTHGGYLVRFMRVPKFRAFQGAVFSTGAGSEWPPAITRPSRQPFFPREGVQEPHDLDPSSWGFLRS